MGKPIKRYYVVIYGRMPASCFFIRQYIFHSAEWSILNDYIELKKSEIREATNGYNIKSVISAENSVENIFCIPTIKN